MFFKSPAYPEPQPADGEERLRYKFAWLPQVVEGGAVWLERFAIRQKYYRSTTKPGLGWWSDGLPERVIWEYR